MIGGPTCQYNGEDIPCFVCCTHNASITSELLVQIMKMIDKRNVFPRNEIYGVPFLMIDGHQSTTKLPFLLYVIDPTHKWMCCIGVPYATHLRQPRDSSKLNGTFKMALYKAKKEYMSKKPRD
jgi:hypothetical protein